MALLTPFQSTLTGVTTTYGACAAGGDTFANTGKAILSIKNAHVGVARTITVDSLVPCNQGSDHNAVATCAASGQITMGPFDPNRFNSPTTGYASITYSDSAADLTIAVILL